jgi:acylphosphatase
LFFFGLPVAQVEGEAQGSDEAIAKLMKDVDDGPRHARVVQLIKEDKDIQEGESGFDVVI